MQLNTIQPAVGAKQSRKRVGRGIGCGLGKTCGRGHKGQSSRSGGFHKVGFEGGQMPLQRRLPKRGFVSLMRDRKEEVTLGQIEALGLDTVDLLTLLQAKLVSQYALIVKVVKTGEIKRSVVIKGLGVTAGAKAAIEAAGGSVVSE